MLLVLGFHAGDKSNTIRLLEWIRELGSVKKHRLLLIVALNTDESGVAELALELFEKVDVLRPNEDINGWPQGANSLWDTAIRAIHRHPEPWLWIEPDCVPLETGWIDAIEAEYKIAEAAKKPFLGDDVNVQGIKRHMSGVAVYPGYAMNFTNKLWQLSGTAWDVFLADEFVPHMYPSKTIQHVFWQSRNPDIEPQFDTPESLSMLRKGAVLFHRNKSGNLINLLRGDGGRRDAVTEVLDVAPSHETPKENPPDENTELRRQITELQERLSEFSKVPINIHRKNGKHKPKRTPEEQEKINARMAAMRAKRFKKQKSNK